MADTYLLPIKNEVIDLPLTNEGGCMDSCYRIQGFTKLPDETIIKKYQFEKISYDYPTTATIKHNRQGYVIDTVTYDAVKGLLTVSFKASEKVGFIELLLKGTYPNGEIRQWLQTIETLNIGDYPY